MPNDVPGAPSNPDTNTTTTQPTSANNGSESNNSPSVSKADFDALMKRVNEQSGIITQLRKSIKTQEPTEPATPTESTPTTPRASAQDKEILKRLEQVEAKEARLRERAKDDAVRIAAKTAGIPEDRLTEFERYFRFEPEYKRLKWNDQNDTVEFTDEYERPAELKSFFEKFLSSPTGQFYRSAPSVGNVPRKGTNQPAGTKSYMDYTAAELAKLSPEAERALRLGARG